jgi:cytochrome c oxidase subunit 3/cytochrome o ubiquinol oxidase subunit 3
MGLLILSESTFFSVFLVAYLFYIGKSQNGPFPADVLDFPVFGTICLLSSSLTIMAAVRSLGRGERTCSAPPTTRW